MAISMNAVVASKAPGGLGERAPIRQRAQATARQPEPAKPTKPTKPTRPAKPAKPTQTTKPTKPAAPKPQATNKPVLPRDSYKPSVKPR